MLLPEGYTISGGLFFFFLLGYVSLTLACVMGTHLAYKQAALCDTTRIIKTVGHIPASWRAFARPSPDTINYKLIMVMAWTVVPMRFALATMLHFAAILISCVPSERLLVAVIPLSAKIVLRVFGLDVRQHGHRLSPMEAPTIAANHVSYFDIYVLQSCGVAPLSFVAKSAVEDMYIIGHLARAFDCVFVSRGKCPEERKHVVDKIRKKQERVINGATRFQLCVFPEGTTTNGRSVMKFRKGAFESLLPVQPVRLDYTSDHSSYTCLDLLYHMLLHLAIASIEDVYCDVYWLPKVGDSGTTWTGEGIANKARLEIARACDRQDSLHLILDDNASLEGHYEITNFLLNAKTALSSSHIKSD
ncbi:Lysophosphatidylcholine acyltransferase 2 [Perkinsus chesapeaki]|uniref:Lysophosphatidylcholine acyltransferase 2 n=1 Tax=Perkinsus chesapeaki TaxID=330153 RepID=A0A7J6MZV2_PERCH|nr:Lysophosphatidylcholine acyltransferase 2 [Perkinsus chesapeaki]